MRFFKDTKGQGSIEILLIIAAVIVVVTLVGLFIKNRASSLAWEGSEDANGLADQIAGDI